VVAGRLFAAEALLPEGWRRDVRFEIGGDGLLMAVTPDASADGAERVAGPVIPGMGNLHSHAFQRGMVGLTEEGGPAGDDFWSWRRLMYRFVERLRPEDVEAIASLLYIEMLKGGYTSVAEFHYLHHDPDGRPYQAATTMADSLIAAAHSAGIGLTLLPTVFAQGGFGGREAAPEQRRFLLSGDRFKRLFDALAARQRDDRLLRVGVALHSLRAVTPEQLAEVVAHVKSKDATAPIHIHIAEQDREVKDCVAWSGARPVEWLFDHAEIDRQWCLVHATHMTERECDRLAASGAVAGLCPVTEANLGDGLFPAERFFAAQGKWGIGSDSQVGLDPFEELRILEYGQRLTARRRNVLTGGPGKSTGGHLYRGALAGGAQALAQPVGDFAPGRRADLVVLDRGTAALAARRDDALLDAAVFGPTRNLVRDVMVAGVWRVKEGHHPAEAAASARYAGVMERVLAG
jgi:formimidoylglutamate deiminase